MRRTDTESVSGSNRHEHERRGRLPRPKVGALRGGRDLEEPRRGHGHAAGATRAVVSPHELTLIAGVGRTGHDAPGLEVEPHKRPRDGAAADTVADCVPHVPTLLSVRIVPYFHPFRCTGRAQVPRQQVSSSTPRATLAPEGRGQAHGAGKPKVL